MMYVQQPDWNSRGSMTALVGSSAAAFNPCRRVLEPLVSGNLQVFFLARKGDS